MKLYLFYDTQAFSIKEEISNEVSVDFVWCIAKRHITCEFRYQGGSKDP